MRGNNVVGVLFSNVHDDKIRELTERRTIASVPFGGRYQQSWRCDKKQFPIFNGSSRLGQSMGFIS